MKNVQQKLLDYTKSKILVTGCDGFIGQSLCDTLTKLGHNVIGVDKKSGIDLSDWRQVEILDSDFDYIFHLAAFNGTKWFYEKPVQVIRDNFYPTENILRKYSGKVKKIIFAGTCESYVGSTETFDYKIPTDELVPLCIPDVTNVRWSYGASKLLNEVMVWSYAKEFNQEMCVIRYHNIYGPNQKDHFITDFISRVKLGDFNLYGSDNTRSFMYIDDAVDLTIHIGLNDKINGTINIGTEVEVKILEVAKKILNHMNEDDTKIITHNSPIGSVNRRCPDISKLKELLFENIQFTTLDEGLKLTINKLL